MSLGRVLVVEDEASYVDALTVGLTREGFIVEVAVDGAEALLKYEDVQPDIVLLDEPTSGISVEEKFGLMDVVMSALKSRKITVLFVEHDMEIVGRFADRVLAFYDGTVIADQTPREVLANPKVLVFFGAFIPQFVDMQKDHVPQVALLGITFMATVAITDAVYALLAGRAGLERSLDPELTGEVLNTRAGQACVAGLATMARVAGIHSVAKKVERQDEHPLLTALGVDFVQGYGIGRPRPLSDLE